MAERVDNRLKHVFLARMTGTGPASFSGMLLLLFSLCWAGWAAAGSSGETGDPDKPEAVQVIMPEVQPRDVSEDEIDDESFEFGIFAGVLNIDNFGSEPLIGFRFSYFATEDLFLQLNYGLSEADLTSFEELSGENVRLLTDEERDYTYYDVLVGYNIFPGEVFMTSSLTFNSSIYLVGGVGNTEFGGEDNFTTTLGTGYRIVLRDWLTWHVDFRDHIFKSDILNEDEVTHNLEMSTGMTLFF
jgi:outer membrane beta-barrel protein